MRKTDVDNYGPQSRDREYFNFWSSKSRHKAVQEQLFGKMMAVFSPQSAIFSFHCPVFLYKADLGCFPCTNEEVVFQSPVHLDQTNALVLHLIRNMDDIFLDTSFI